MTGRSLSVLVSLAVVFASFLMMYIGVFYWDFIDFLVLPFDANYYSGELYEKLSEEHNDSFFLIFFIGLAVNVLHFVEFIFDGNYINIFLKLYNYDLTSLVQHIFFISLFFPVFLLLRKQIVLASTLTVSLVISYAIANHFQEPISKEILLSELTVRNKTVIIKEKQHKDEIYAVLLDSFKEQRFEEFNHTFSQVGQVFVGKKVSGRLLNSMMDDFLAELESDDSLLRKYENSGKGDYYHELMGLLFVEKGWKARGKLYRRKTSDEKIFQMKRYFHLAIEQFDEIPSDDWSMFIYSNLIQIYKALGDNLAKEKVFFQALKVPALQTELQYNMINSYAPKWGGSYTDMLKWCKRAREYKLLDHGMVVECIEILNYHSTDYFKKDNKKMAIRYLERNFAYNYRYIDIFTLAPQYEYEDDYESLNDLTKLVVDYYPNDQYIQAYRAVSLRKVREYEQAVKYADKAVALNINPAWYKRVAYVYDAAGEYDKATAIYRKAIQISPDDSYSYGRLSKIYLSHSKINIPQALVITEQWITSQPENEDAWFYRGYALHESGDSSDKQILAKYLEIGGENELYEITSKLTKEYVDGVAPDLEYRIR